MAVKTCMRIYGVTSCVGQLYLKMKKNLLLLAAIFAVLDMAAQDKIRVAVFEPAAGNGEIDAGTKIAIREIIGSVIINTGGYALVERSMLEYVMREQAFANSGIVDDTQATEIGELAGADKVVVSIVTKVGSELMFSVKLLDVRTAAVEKQQVRFVLPGALIGTVEPVAYGMFSDSRKSPPTAVPFAKAPPGKGDDPKTGEVLDGEKVWSFVERKPQFPGGDAALMKYLAENIQYPKDAMENGIQGRVVIGFVVSKDGWVRNVKVLTGIYPSLNAEAIRVVRSLPRFIPGEQNGIAVNVSYAVPVSFILR